MNISQPTVSIIIVNYNGSHLLRRCLQSIDLLKYPKKNIEVIVVDNGSTDGSASFIRQNFPWVNLISCRENLGFTGGNNIGIERAKGKVIVLLNNDTEVTENWLIELVLASKPKDVGIVTSKMLYSVPHIKLNIKSSVIQQSNLDGSSDFSPRGVLMEDVISSNSQQNNAYVWYNSGFKKTDQVNGVSLRWTTGIAEIFLPIYADTNNNFTIVFHGYPTSEQLNCKIELSIGDRVLYKNVIKPCRVKQVEIALDASEYKDDLIWLVQNAGNVLMKNGYSKDRGSILTYNGKKVLEFYEPDSEYFNQKRLVVGGCGAGMLIKRELIEAVGSLDGHYFMYYEDVDFSLRAWKMGWNIVYAPKAVLYHDHRATTGKTESPFTINLTERNHLFILFTHYPLATCITEYLLFLIRLFGSFFFQTILKFVTLSYYHIWKSKAQARLEAITTFHKLLPTIIKNRIFWEMRQKRSYTELEQHLY